MQVDTYFLYFPWWSNRQLLLLSTLGSDGLHLEPQDFASPECWPLQAAKACHMKSTCVFILSLIGHRSGHQIYLNIWFFAILWSRMGSQTKLDRTYGPEFQCACSRHVLLKKISPGISGSPPQLPGVLKAVEPVVFFWKEGFSDFW